MHQAVDRSAGYAIAAPPVTTLAIAGADTAFPVARVYCVGRNYAEHSIEMGHDPDREPPFFFMKPADAVVPPGRLPFPTGTGELHHEIELVVALGEGGRDIPAERALDYVFGYAVGLDMTRRDLQAAAKKAGRPWDMAKGFDQSAPTGSIRTVEDIGHPTEGAVWLRINGEPRQRRRPRPADLDSARDDRLPEHARHAASRRPHHDRDAERRRPGRAGRPPRGPHRRCRRPERQLRLLSIAGREGSRGTPAACPER